MLNGTIRIPSAFRSLLRTRQLNTVLIAILILLFDVVFKSCLRFCERTQKFRYKIYPKNMITLVYLLYLPLKESAHLFLQKLWWLRQWVVYQVSLHWEDSPKEAENLTNKYYNKLKIIILCFLGNDIEIVKKYCFLLAFQMSECILLRAHRDAIFFFESAEAISFNKDGIMTANCISSVYANLFNK